MHGPPCPAACAEAEVHAGQAGWFVYLLACSDGSLYTGITVDPERRCREHNAGRGAAYTRSRTPVRLVHQETAAGRSEALKRELEIKGWPRRRKLDLAGLTELPAGPEQDAA
jgi:putative endonuclease